MFVWKCLQKYNIILSKCKRNVMQYQQPEFYSFTTITSSNNTIREIIQHWRQRFEKAGIPEPVESIEHIIAHIIGTNKIIDIVNYQEQKFNNEQIKKLNSLCECRLLRMPVQYIIGEWDFRDITVKLIPPIFIPRPETEILVDIVLKHISTMCSNSYKILEIGCGSGAISLALAHSCKKIDCIAIDTNIHACDLAMENAQNLKLTEYLTIINATLLEDGTIKSFSSDNTQVDLNIEKHFDFIVSNPPYIPTKQILKLDPEIKIFEDIRALDGGKDGLKVIKPLLKYAASALKPDGRLFMEVDPVQPQYIQFFTTRYTNFKLQHTHTYKDFSNNNRFVEVVKLD